MASVFKKSPSEPFRVPTLAEADTDYATLETRLTEIGNSATSLRREESGLVAAIAADRSGPRPMSADVARLLGDAVDDGPSRRRERLSEVRREIALHDAAAEIARDRLRHAKGPASGKVCDAVRGEYGRRVKALVEALEAAATARDAYESLADELEANDVSWTGLGVFRPTFMGDRRNGHVPRLAREAREAGYVG